MRPLYSVRVDNLEQTIAVLRDIDAGMARELVRDIRKIAKPTLAKAKGYASGLGSNPTGAYAASMSLRSRATGVKLASSDPGAGVIEFANPGAVILTGPRRGRRAPVPNGSFPPRALLRAVLDDEDSIVRQLDEAVSRYIDGVMGNG